MGYRLTGIGGFGFSINWEKVPGDEDIARSVVTFLENRRLLFGERHCEDQMHCVNSAIQIRDFLTRELTNAKPGKSLDDSIRAMRAAFRKFVEAAGPNACNFGREYGPYGSDPFSAALSNLRTLVGLHLQVIAEKYGIDIEPELAHILPPDISFDNDLSILPGWED
jgi:hypothetical protein